MPSVAGKTFTILVNGRTAEVAGERPYSAAKITSRGHHPGLLVIGAVITTAALHNR